MSCIKNHESLEIIDHTFLVVGQARLECDIDHAIIERKKIDYWLCTLTITVSWINNAEIQSFLELIREADFQWTRVGPSDERFHSRHRKPLVVIEFANSKIIDHKGKSGFVKRFLITLRAI